MSIYITPMQKTLSTFFKPLTREEKELLDLKRKQEARKILESNVVEVIQLDNDASIVNFSNSSSSSSSVIIDLAGNFLIYSYMLVFYTCFNF